MLSSYFYRGLSCLILVCAPAQQVSSALLGPFVVGETRAWRGKEMDYTDLVGGGRPDAELRVPVHLPLVLSPVARLVVHRVRRRKRKLKIIDCNCWTESGTWVSSVDLFCPVCREKRPKGIVLRHKSKTTVRPSQRILSMARTLP